MREWKITARWWSTELQTRFGEIGAAHILSDSEIVRLIIEFGRADIYDDVSTIEFNNDYD